MVGPAEIDFTVHRALIASHSDFFRAAFNWPAYEGVVCLDDEVPRTFGMFVQYCYFGKIFSKKEDEQVGCSQDKDEVKGEDKTETVHVDDDDEDGDDLPEDEEWDELIELYLLGQRLEASKFKDAVIDAIIEKADGDTDASASRRHLSLPVDQAKKVYDNTVGSAKLRELIVDFHVYGFKGETLKTGAGARPSPDVNAPKEFLQDVLQEVLRAGGDLYAKKKTLPWIEKPCAYHEHGEDKPCAE